MRKGYNGVIMNISIQQSLFWYHTINKKVVSQVVSLWVHGISKVRYISVNNGKYR